jgi:hypothetical protein
MHFGGQGSSCDLGIHVITKGNIQGLVVHFRYEARCLLTHLNIFIRCDNFRFVSFDQALFGGDQILLLGHIHPQDWNVDFGIDFDDCLCISGKLITTTSKIILKKLF